MQEPTLSKQQILDIQATCICLQARERAQTLTKEYDSMLAPSGLRITQFSIVSILLAGPTTIGELANDLRIDRTTLTRNVVPLVRDGYIRFEEGQDARKRILTLTPKGTQATRQALGLWRQAQSLHGIKQQD